MIKFSSYTVLTLSIIFSINGQDLNVIPDILSPIYRSLDQLNTINFMANVSEKLFHLKKSGFAWGENCCQFIRNVMSEYRVS